MNRIQLRTINRWGNKMKLPRKSNIEIVDESTPTLTHIDQSSGEARMVDISDKALSVMDVFKKIPDNSASIRWAKAEGRLSISDDVRTALQDQLATNDKDQQQRSDIRTPKGDVFQVARLAGIQAAKETSRLIPLCHQVALSHIALDFWLEEDSIRIESRVKAVAQATGVEMEALTAVSIAALTCYDMLKSLKPDRLIIEGIRLLEKHGGASTCQKTNQTKQVL